MNICVTGGTGLIARYLIWELSKKTEHCLYAIVSNDRVEFAKSLYEENSNVYIVSNEDFFSTNNADILPGAIVINTAFTRKNDGIEIAKSLDYAYNLFLVCKKRQVEGIINISSRSVYQEPAPGELNNEDSVIDANSLIATAKYGVELLLKGMFDQTAIKHTSLRCASVNELKADNNMTRPLNVFVDCVISGDSIKVFNGSQIMSFIDPRDVAQAVMLMCMSDKDWKPIYNVGPDSSCTCKLIDMARRVIVIGKELGFKEVPIDVIKKDIFQTAGLNSELLQHDFGYKPQFDLDMMIKALFEMKRAK